MRRFNYSVYIPFQGYYQDLDFVEMRKKVIDNPGAVGYIDEYENDAYIGVTFFLRDEANAL